MLRAGSKSFDVETWSSMRNDRDRRTTNAVTTASGCRSSSKTASSPASPAASQRKTTVLFSWDISPHWQIETDPEKTSEVEVRFIAETPERTRVELEHRNLERHGDGWEGVRAGVAGDAGWALYLRRFGALFAEDG
jgi:hypothetical protein